jgi:alkanesulfonate monooxygenase SsuD/methylene tetrahydromethanopterin reductase-like flavin-dependent oxidoreductase (luciferase family)
MKIGLRLHPERGLDAVFEEAQQADRQGYDTIWLADHLANYMGPDTPDGPLDSFTLMTALGAVTTRVRLAWAMLNISFRAPAVLAKMLSTLDRITHGRVICSLGAGWYKKEYAAYDVPLLDDHDDRVAFAREVVQLFKKLWAHPAPETISFSGRWIKIHDLSFSPVPHQKPHPPIWLGGDSAGTIALVKEFADGWFAITNATRDKLAELRQAPDWPKRPLTIAKNVRIFVAETRDQATEDARKVFASGVPNLPKTVEEFMANEIVGNPAECLTRISDIGAWGINYLRIDCADPAHQERVARLILPALT